MYLLLYKKNKDGVRERERERKTQESKRKKLLE